MAASEAKIDASSYWLKDDAGVEEDEEVEASELSKLVGVGAGSALGAGRAGKAERGCGEEEEDESQEEEDEENVMSVVDRKA